MKQVISKDRMKIIRKGNDIYYDYLERRPVEYCSK